MTRSASILAAIALAASVSANAQQTVNLYNISANYYEFKDTENGNYHMTFSSYTSREDSAHETVYTHADADGNYWEVNIDIWAGRQNQSAKNKGILPAGTYGTAETHDVADSFFTGCSFVRQYDQWGDIAFEASLPETITIIKVNNNRYEFTFDVEDITFRFGYEDKNNIVNIPFEIHGAVDQTFEEHIIETERPLAPGYEYIPEQPAVPAETPAATTAIGSISADSAQSISFSGNTLTLSDSAYTIIADMNGRVVLSATASTIDVSNLASGLYIAHSAGQSLKFMKN